ncbi:MAG: hypothetical protein H7A21_11570 [Spirochaetales bacterium]|nr:hypothetical protein [Leptospiraceae bacterium]MCP5482065.1 hypothetical protein [Spirochaetales bacterium]MCP5484979.1 hypothetical protein [Spirochaetales bacterium]
MRLRTGAALFGVWLAGPGMAALSGEEHSLMPDGVRLRGPVERVREYRVEVRSSETGELVESAYREFMQELRFDSGRLVYARSYLSASDDILESFLPPRPFFPVPAVDAWYTTRATYFGERLAGVTRSSDDGLATETWQFEASGLLQTLERNTRYLEPGTYLPDPESRTVARFSYIYDGQRRLDRTIGTIGGEIIYRESRQRNQRSCLTRVSIQDADLREVRDYECDDACRPVRITIGGRQMELEYDSGGMLTQWNLFSASEPVASTRYVYNEVGDPIEIAEETFGESVMRNRSYTYDANGNWTRMQEVVRSEDAPDDQQETFVLIRKIEYRSP